MNEVALAAVLIISNCRAAREGGREGARRDGRQRQWHHGLQAVTAWQGMPSARATADCTPSRVCVDETTDMPPLSSGSATEHCVSMYMCCWLGSQYLHEPKKDQTQLHPQYHHQQDWW